MHKYLLSSLIFCCWLFSSGRSFAQTPQTFYYTTKDGLPSNSIYRTVLDKHGFLWIASENGLAKFDGKSFKTYTTAQGLPDNEITDIFIDSSNTIWVTPFRRTPAYYNPVKDRFENEETDPELQKIELGNANRGSVLQYGGIAFCNNQRNFFIYKNGKVTLYKGLLNSSRASTPERVIEYRPDNYILVCSDSIRVFSNRTIIKKYPLSNEQFYSEYFNHTLYIGMGHTIKKFVVDINGNIFPAGEKELPFTIRVFCRAGKNLAVTTFNGTTYPIDTATLELRDPLLYDIAVRNVLEDKNGSTWISTIDKGLVKVQQKRISSYTINDKLLNDQITQNFNTLLIINNKIIVGNNYGEVFIYDKVYDIQKRSLSKDKNMDGVVRKIVELKDKIYVACQTGSFLLNKKTFEIIKRFEGKDNASPKSAHLLNDSVLLLGSHITAQQYNVFTNSTIANIIKRVTAFGKGPTQKIYVGSNDGLYRWDKDSLFYFGKQYKSLGYRVNTIFTTADGLMWVGLGSDSLLVLKNDQLIQAIAIGGIVPGNVCKSLYSNKAGEIWLGTNKGLNKIQYQLTDKKFTYNNTFFGTADGLIGEQINDITIYHDTVYVATTGGISFLPVNLHLPVADITTFITGVSIDGKETMVLDNYTLPYDSKDINISFSGVDLTGYFPLFEYRVNDGAWLKLDKNNIELRLSAGKYDIQIRGIKRNGTASSQSANVSIFIRTPFWKNSVFWAFFTIAFFTFILLILQNRSRQKQKKAVEKVVTEKKLAQLEMQALKAQINPHFVFNCLNSIKGFIYDKDYLQADKYLDKFSDLMRSTIDNSDTSVISLRDEIAYLDNYLQLEKLRFEEKFSYSITAADNIPKEKVYVPAMLLQPYVENAIRHGMRFLETKKGHIAINIKQEDNFLVCEINDDGIGREKAAALKSQQHIEYQSKGMSISKRRADLYNIKLEVIDKKEDSGIASGTTIIVKIPLDLQP